MDFTVEMNRSTPCHIEISLKRDVPLLSVHGLHTDALGTHCVRVTLHDIIKVIPGINEQRLYERGSVQPAGSAHRRRTLLRGSVAMGVTTVCTVGNAVCQGFPVKDVRELWRCHVIQTFCFAYISSSLHHHRLASDPPRGGPRCLLSCHTASLVCVNGDAFHGEAMEARVGPGRGVSCR